MPNGINLLSVALLLLAGLAVGFLLGAWLTRRLNATQSAVLVEKLKGDSVAELATARERARGLEADAQKLNAEITDARRAVASLRNELDAARDERAQLAERAGRVPVLEADLTQAKSQLQEAQERILQLSTSEAEKARELRGLIGRNTELTSEIETAAARTKELTQSFTASQASCAGLTADNERITPLFEQGARLEQENTRLQTAAATLREDFGRIQAELQAEREAHGIVRDELGSTRSKLSGELASMTGQVSEVGRSLSESQAQCAALQADNQRISPLVEQVSSLDQENSRLQGVTGALREDIGRIQAELQAEREAHALVRTEAGQTKDRLGGEVTTLSERVTNLSRSFADSQAQCAVLQANNERIAPLVEQVGKLESDNSGLMRSLAALREDVGRVQAELQAEKDAHTLVRSDATAARQQLVRAQTEVANRQSQLTELTTRLEAERKQSDEKLALLLGAKDALSNQFKSLANDILEEKSKRFTEQNQNNLGQLLDPLKTRLQEFQGKIELFYDTEGKQRSALAQQVSHLMDLNKTLSDDAKNLTLALKGSSKSQGSWGELILERVLEASGLRKGEEYDVQESHMRDDGSRAQPDVVIHLPEQRHLVVDAKVSLTAYEEYASAASDAERQIALRRHLDSIRGHIKGLSERNYQELYGLKSLDFVLMFVPIEPAFMLGVTQDNKLFMDAWTKNVLLVSPSTLLFVVRTVAHLWRQEAQNRNAQEIAKRGGELYDRFVAFVVDLEKIGDRLRMAKESYDEAFAKLSTNKGNVIRQAEMLKDLGVKPNKALPRGLLESAGAAQDE
jgi:DNA recombination protein RmuC